MLRIQDNLLEGLLQYCYREKECVFLDTSLPDDENSQSLLFVKPVRRLVCQEGDDLENYLQQMQKSLEEGHYLAGWVSYEFGSMLEGRYARDTSTFSTPPAILADFGVFLKPYKFNHHTGENNFPIVEKTSLTLTDNDFSLQHLRPNMSQEEFVDALHKVKEYIAAGDTYQVNYTMKLLFGFQGSIEALYRSLRRNQSVCYGAYIKSSAGHVLSFSPELFFRKSGKEIVVRPMKGTYPRGNHLQEERQYKEVLHQDTKNRAENVMIVDLLRNDLSRLLFDEQESSVTTTSLFDVESYESLLQMTSTVIGECGQDSISHLSISRLFHSLFPCGSITGAPKIRTMQIIEELEKESRGVYTGAIGYIAPGGEAAFNVPIRTVHLRGGKGEMGIGAGITHDSDPVQEWHESLLKGRFLTHLQQPFQLFETIFWHKESGYYLLDSHLQRLQKGADYFKFSCSVEEIEAVLQKQVELFSGESMRVRVTLEKDGRVSISQHKCEPPDHTTLPAPSKLALRKIAGTVGFAKKRIEELSPYLFYKTSRRSLYDEEHAVAREKGDLDSLFLNAKNELTEGCISNVVVLKNGVYLTPPVDSGLLSGVMREQLLSSSSDEIPLFERPLFRKDVEEADALFICNSVRGVVRVQLLL